MVKKLALLVVCMAIGAVAFAGWPVLSAYQLRQAIKAGDSATLSQKVDWDSVRRSLKASIDDLAAVSTTMGPDGGDDRAGPGDTPRPSLWSRLKLAMAPAVASRFIDTYVTPEGISRLAGMKEGWRASKSAVGQVADGDLEAAQMAWAGEAALGSIDRFLAFYRRIVRAHFQGLDLVEFEVADRSVPERRYVSAFRLTNLEWKLVSVRVVGQAF